MALEVGIFLFFSIFVSVTEIMSIYKTCAMLFYYITLEAEKLSPQ